MKKILLAFLIFAYAMTASSQQLRWTAIADFPQVRYAPFNFMIGNDFYAGGGLTAVSPNVAIDDLYKYDSINNIWVAKAAIPGSLDLFAAGCFVINGKAYICDGQIIGGTSNYNSNLWEYDPSTDSWTTKAPFPGIPGYTSTAFAIGQYGYMGLGFSPLLKTFYRYDSQADSWTQIDDLPGAARQSAAAFVINGSGYVGLGGVQVSSNFANDTDFYKYDTMTKHWTSIASFPGMARRDCASFALNGKGYIVGGVGTTATDVFKDIWEYDPTSNSWTQLDTFPGGTMRNGAYGGNGSWAIAGAGQKQDHSLSSQMWKTTNVNTSVTDLDQNTSNVWFHNNSLHVRFEKPLSDEISLMIYDMSGRKVLQSSLSKGDDSFDISLNPLAGGIYIYEINSYTNTAKHSGKLVIEK